MLLYFSEIMQYGASLTSSQLLKILTRGKTSRLSAEPLLDFFRPLKVWLEQQNRGEVIGWNSNLDDVALFQPLVSGAKCRTAIFSYFWTFIVAMYFFYLC